MASGVPVAASHSFGLEWAHELEEGIVGNISRLSCMEIIPENFFDGRFGDFLDFLAESGVPVAVHGVLLSLGSMEPLREDHLGRVLEIASRVNMVNFSEHLSLTRVDGVDLDSLTPLAWMEEVLDGVCAKISRIQKRLAVPFLIENVANRFIVPGSEYSETEFINEVIARTGCGLLLDVTNVYTNSVNFGFDPYAWLDEIDVGAARVLHLAGGFRDAEGYLMDSHDNSICEEVWSLYSHVVAKVPPLMTIVERTGNFPRFADLVAELSRAEAIVSEVATRRPEPLSSLRDVRPEGVAP